MMIAARFATEVQRRIRAVNAALPMVWLLGIAWFAALAIFAGVSCQGQAAPIVLPWTMTTIAGNGAPGTPVSGELATSTSLSSDLRAVDVDGQGDVFIADANSNMIEEVNRATGKITIVAGGASAVCSGATDKVGDGCPATQAELNTPRGLALDKAGNIYIADYNDSMVRMVNHQTGIITNLAGAPGTKTYTGDGGAASASTLNEPRGVRVDNDGNIWICDTSNNVVREIFASNQGTYKAGDIYTVVGYNPGTGSAATGGFAGDGSAANSSGVELHEPTDVVFDSANNAYIVDFSNSVIREVNASTDIIETIIGENGSAAPTTAPSWPAPATTTPLGNPTKIAIDSEGNLYFADSSESVVYLYDPSAQTIMPIAGEYGYGGTASSSFPVCASATDVLGDGCPATQALFNQGNSALGVAIDANNDLYISDPADDRIREASTDLTFAASNVGTAESQTVEVHFAAGDSPAAKSGIVAGSSAQGFTLPSAASCTTNSDTTTDCTVTVQFNPVNPGVAFSPLAVTGVKSHRSFPLRGVGKGVLSSFDPGTSSLMGSSLSAERGAALDAAGNLYIADTGNNRVVEENATTGAQTVFAGTGTAGYSGDGGLAASAALSGPTAVAVSYSGMVYIADTGNNVVRVVDPISGDISTYAGGATTVCSIATLVLDAQGDGCPATQATLKAPAGLATDILGNLYIADTGDNLIRRVDAGSGTINLEAGLIAGATVCSASSDSYGDGCAPSQASFNSPAGLAAGGDGDLLVADSGDNKIRMISAGANLVTSVAGNGQSVFTGDGGAATSASLNAPEDVKVDAAGDVYIADTGNAVVRLVSASSGDISSLLGLGGNSGSAGGSGSASTLQLSSPAGLAVSPSGEVFVSDGGNNRLVEDDRNAALLAFGSSNIGVETLEQTATISDSGNQSLVFAGTPFYTATGDTADFVLDNSAESACAGGQTLTAGADCTLAAAFEPTATGTYTESLATPGNAVNAASAGITLSGTGVNLPTTMVSIVLTSPSSGSLSYGEAATFTATVAPTSGTGVPTGSLTFTVDGVEQPETTLSATGTAALTLNLTVGKHTIAAVYSGSSAYAPSNSTLTETVSLAATTTVLTISPATVITGNPAVLSAQVTSATTGVPTGTVTFMAGGAALGAPVTLSATGTATLTLSTLAIAQYSVTAVYSGDPNYATSSSGVVPLAVTPIPPGFTMVAAPATLSVPQGGTTQTILALAPAGGISGTVTFSCSGLPANTTCTFYPTTLSLPTANAASTCSTQIESTGPQQFPTTDVCTSMTITTNVPPVALNARLEAPSTRSRVLAATLLLPALLLLMPFSRRRRQMPLLLVAVLCLAGLVSLSGCASNATQTPAQSSPVGTSTIKVTASGPDNVTQTIPVSVNILTATAVTAQLSAPPAVGVGDGRPQGVEIAALTPVDGAALPVLRP